MYGYIYLIVNNINGKTYVGQHICKTILKDDGYMGSGKIIKQAIRKYGIGNFEKFLIQYCDSKEELNKQEIFWIAEYRSRGKAEYNIADGGGGTSGVKNKYLSERNRNYCWNKGKKTGPLSEETKKKMSDSHKGKSPWNKGIKTGLEPWNKGKRNCFSKETLEKLSEVKNGKPHPHKGHKISEETKRKMSETKKGKKHNYYSIGNKGMHWYNNGEKEVLTKECPEGYKLGRIQK